MTSDYLKQIGAQGHLKVKEALRKWDPIGVYYPGSDCPDNEYDGYSGAVVGFLDHGSPKEEILRYLERVCVEHMEMPFDRARASAAIEELLVFWPQWKKQLKELGPHHIPEA
jgi:hypothetical protein